MLPSTAFMILILFNLIKNETISRLAVQIYIKLCQDRWATSSWLHFVREITNWGIKFSTFHSAPSYISISEISYLGRSLGTMYALSNEIFCISLNNWPSINFEWQNIKLGTNNSWYQVENDTLVEMHGVITPKSPTKGISL